MADSRTLIDRMPAANDPVRDSFSVRGSLVGSFTWDNEIIVLWVDWAGHIVSASRLHPLTKDIIELWPLDS